jgi:hypothetical protein
MGLHDTSVQNARARLYGTMNMVTLPDVYCLV